MGGGIGDWLKCGEGRPKWGDKYETAVEAFGLAGETLRKYKEVSSAFKFGVRAPNLSWSHHQALAYQPADVRKKLLKEAEPARGELGASVRLIEAVAIGSPAFKIPWMIT